MRPVPKPTKCLLNSTYAQGYLTSSSAPSLSNERSQSSSFSSPATPKQTVSSFKIMTIKRGFTDEADQLLNCLVLTFNSLSHSSDTHSGTWYIRRLGTSIPEKFRFCDLPRELSDLHGCKPLINRRQDNNNPNKLGFSAYSQVHAHICGSSVVESYTFNFSVSQMNGTGLS